MRSICELNSTAHSRYAKRILQSSSVSFEYNSLPRAKRHKTLANEAFSDFPNLLHHDSGDECFCNRNEEGKSDSGTESQPENGRTNVLSVCKTNLETALPPVVIDREAITEYESKTAPYQVQGPTTHDRLQKRDRARSRSSIYVDAFRLALDTVLEAESHLFNEAELTLLDEWKRLTYEAQYLYVRLFLRKTAAWHRINRLGYHQDISNLNTAVLELFENRFLPEVAVTDDPNHGVLGMSLDHNIGTRFSFAESSNEHINTLEEASNLLLLDELKVIAKDARIQGRNKAEMLKALRSTSQRQSEISWRSLSRSKTEVSIDCAPPGVEAEVKDIGLGRDAYFIDKILHCTGECIRLCEAPLKLFERVHLVFYRSTEWTEKSLKTIILSKISRRNFPEYIVSRSTTIFPDRATVLEFEAALRTQFNVDNALEANGVATKEAQFKVKDIAEKIYPRWKILLQEEEQKEERIYDSSEGAYLRRFSPAWVYTRIIHKGTECIARLKEHAREHALLVELLDQRLFHAARRGAWYQRKALVEEHYMWTLTPSCGRNEEQQKRYWKQIALQTCEDALGDRECHLIYHYDLQKRILKLERSLKVAKRHQHDFSHLVLAKPFERTFSGVRVDRAIMEITGQRQGVNQARTKAIGNKTIWIDDREGGGECGVEAMCLSKYRELGYRGFHTEAGLLRTLFGLLFYDILFAYVPNVFQTPFQTCPLDLHTDAFYSTRYSEISHRLARLSNNEAPQIFHDAWEKLSTRQVCVVGVDWGFDREDLLGILKCFPGHALAVICKVMAQEYQQRGGGIPDLLLWHPERREILFAEVKSENDRLSDSQRLWIHVLAGAGVTVELCHAVAKEARTGE